MYVCLSPSSGYKADAFVGFVLFFFFFVVQDQLMIVGIKVEQCHTGPGLVWLDDYSKWTIQFWWTAD